LPTTSSPQRAPRRATNKLPIPRPQPLWKPWRPRTECSQ
jgi:hypothetical protein